MRSSLTTPIRPQLPQLPDRPELLALLSSVADHRSARGVRHQLPGILAVGLAAVLAGARSFVAISEWVTAQSAPAIALLGVTGTGRPSESTIRRAMTGLDADQLDRVIGAFVWTRTRDVVGRRVIAIDGKTVRGARTAKAVAPHLVAAFDHATGTVLGQVAVAAKSNEIPAVRDLLACFDLTGAVVTVDAMHTQVETAQAITAAGGDYVFTVKKNQPTLHHRCQELPWKDVPGHRATTTAHGRRVTRTIKVVTAPTWIQFVGAAQIAQVRRTVTRGGKKSVEVVYLISSADHHAAPPATLAAWVQGHWGIENRLHWVRDVTFDEDRSQVRTGNAPQVMATLRNTAISLLRRAGWTNIASALRHHAAHPDHVITRLLTC